VTLANAGACGADPAGWERRWRDVATEAAAEPPSAGEARPPVPPRELPMDTYAFTGRAASLAR
jgi:hypothetical protein